MLELALDYAIFATGSKSNAALQIYLAKSYADQQHAWKEYEYAHSSFLLVFDEQSGFASQHIPYAVFLTSAII
ncbi:MAG: hypothetical protein HHJ12_11940 [Glaciimonas sp.]|nr:hypothetical protein [Glaciimonas sp.]